MDRAPSDASEAHAKFKRLDSSSAKGKSMTISYYTYYYKGGLRRPSSANPVALRRLPRAIVRGETQNFRAIDTPLIKSAGFERWGVTSFFDLQFYEVLRFVEENEWDIWNPEKIVSHTHVLFKQKYWSDNLFDKTLTDFHQKSSLITS